MPDACKSYQPDGYGVCWNCRGDRAAHQMPDAGKDVEEKLWRWRFVNWGAEVYYGPLDEPEGKPFYGHMDDAPRLTEALNALQQQLADVRQERDRYRERLDASHRALDFADAHVDELVEAWRSGALSEKDGKGGLRSNRNYDVKLLLSSERKKNRDSGLLIPPQEVAGDE